MYTKCLAEFLRTGETQGAWQTFPCHCLPFTEEMCFDRTSTASLGMQQ